MKNIDLNNFKPKNVKVLSGRTSGQDAREKIKLSKLEEEHDKIVIIVPDDLYSINSSFFLGLFGPSVRKLGELGFRDKYIFMCDEIIMKNIEDGISYALKDSNVLNGA